MKIATCYRNAHIVYIYLNNILFIFFPLLLKTWILYVILFNNLIETIRKRYRDHLYDLTHTVVWRRMSREVSSRKLGRFKKTWTLVTCGSKNCPCWTWPCQSSPYQPQFRQRACSVTCCGHWLQLSGSNWVCPWVREDPQRRSPLNPHTSFRCN